MNERKTIGYQLRVVFQELYKVDPSLPRRPIKRDPIEDTLPDFPIPR